MLNVCDLFKRNKMTSSFASAQLIDLERLQQLSFERSKIWATFLDNIAESENHCEIPIDQVDELFGNLSEDEMDDLASMEDENYDDKSVDSEVLRDITNSTRLALMFAGGGGNITAKLPETPANEENNELIDLFNQTLPVINEHNRQMKESGIDRILNTFDAKKIEEKVGGWLRRNNSLCGNNCSMETKPHRKIRKTPQLTKKPNTSERSHRSPAYRATKPYMNFYPDEEIDSDASFNSGETARYIRSSRAGAMKNTSSSTMMIKTYRMVKSTRQALREKYACDQDDDADSHLDELRHRRKLAMHYRNDKHSSGRSHKLPLYQYQYVTPSHSTTSKRRKILRKRTASNSCSTVDTSSDSDSYYYDDDDKYYHRKHPACCTQRHCGRYVPAPLPPSTPSSLTASVKRSQYRSLKNMPHSRKERMYYYIQSHTHSMSSSSSSNSFSRAGVKKRLKRLEHRSYDTRPSRRESECRCCNEKRLCKEYKHLADTSTEEWFVENCYSPRKPQLVALPEPMAVKIDNQRKPINQKKIEKRTTNQITTNEKNKDDPPPSPPKKARKNTSNVPKKTVNEIKQKMDPLEIDLAEDSFEFDLQTALKLSKEQYEKDRRDKANAQKQEHDPNAVEEKNKLPTVAAMEVDQIVVKHVETEASLNSVTNNRNNATISGTEETFFAFSKPIYNSTTVDSDKTEKLVKLIEFDEDTKDRTNVSNENGMGITKSKTKNARKKGTAEDAQNVETKLLQKEEVESSEVKSCNDDHVFAKPQARPKVAVTTKNVSNVGSFLETNGLGMCNSTAKVGQKRAIQRQQNIETERSTTAAKTVHVATDRIETLSFFTSPSRSNNEIQNTEVKIKKSATVDDDNSVSLVDSNRNNVSMVKEANNNKCSQNDSSSSSIKVSSKSMHAEKENNEPERQSKEIQLGKSKTKIKPDLERSSSMDNPIKKQTNRRKKVEKVKFDTEEYITSKDVIKAKQAEKENNDLERINAETTPVNFKGTEIIKHDSARSVSTEDSIKQQSINPKNVEKEEFGNENSELQKIIEKTPIGHSKRSKNIKQDLPRSSSTEISNKKRNTRRKKLEEKEQFDNEDNIKITKSNKLNKGTRDEYEQPQQQQYNEDTDKKYREIEENKLMEVNQQETRVNKNDESAELRDIPNREHCTVTLDRTNKSQNKKGNKTNHSSNVTSTTTIHSPEICTSRKKSQQRSHRRHVISDSSGQDDDENDCTVVTSTTNVDTLELSEKNETKPRRQPKTASLSSTVVATQSAHVNAARQNQTLPSHLLHPKKGILIYAPHDSSTAPSHSFSNDGSFFNITLEHLSTIIGQKPAEKFLKYYIGRRRFNSTSTVYFKPPAPGVLDTNDASSSDSDEDDLECIGQYGDLYESFGGHGGQQNSSRL